MTDLKEEHGILVGDFLKLQDFIDIVRNKKNVEFTDAYKNRVN